MNAPFAISGDYLIVPAGGAGIQSEDSWANLPEGGGAHMIALTLGGEPQDESAAAATPQADATPEVEQAEDTVSVDAFDIGFDPAELTIAADTDVTIAFENTGFLEHDLAIEGTDYITEILTNGGKEDLVVNLPAGEYTYYCTVPGHRQSGMVGTLTVE